MGQGCMQARVCHHPDLAAQAARHHARARRRRPASEIVDRNGLAVLGVHAEGEGRRGGLVDDASADRSPGRGGAARSRHCASLLHTARARRDRVPQAGMQRARKRSTAHGHGPPGRRLRLYNNMLPLPRFSIHACAWRHVLPQCPPVCRLHDHTGRALSTCSERRACEHHQRAPGCRLLIVVPSSRAVRACRSLGSCTKFVSAKFSIGAWTHTGGGPGGLLT